MAQKRTLDLLPEIFQTDTNRKFLSATLDQLTQEPRIDRIRGFVGRRVGPGVNPNDSYVTEPTETRTDYQLEPGVISLKPGTQAIMDAITYPGMLDSLGIENSATDQQDRLWQSEFYSWDPFCDFDKFVNYSQYYWLPEGPEAVDVSSSIVPLTDDFVVDKQRLTYKISGFADENPEITLVRGGNYGFIVDQPGSGFFIQATPGTSGRLPFSPNISSRDVLGVTNNGADTGTVTFDVPLRSAQDFYYQMPDVGPVDLICTLKFDQINNVFVDTFLQQNPQGIDGVTDLNGRTLIFITSPNLEIGGWQVNSRFDPLTQGPENNDLPGSFDSIPYAEYFNIVDPDVQFSIWRVQYSEGPRPFMTLLSIQPVPRLSKFSIAFGTEYSNTQWYKNASGVFEQIPLLTAIQDILYYQDSRDASAFGIIRLIDPSQSDPLDIESIVGAKTYISPNKVKFTNGLKVVFRGDVKPESFRDREFYVEGVGTGPGVTERVGFVDGEAYYGPWHFVEGRRVTGLPGTESYQQYIYNSLEESQLNRGLGAPDLAPLPSLGVPGVVMGNGIKLLPVEDFVTPEPYIREQDVYQDVDAAIPLVPDYITINRAANNHNAWSRSNRWFHIDVITATAEYNNNQIPVLDNNTRAKRPIIEFRANLALYNSGALAKVPVDVIDFLETDALSNIAGQEGYDEWDGYAFQQGSLVVFAADQDPQVRNRIYRVDFIDPDGSPGTPPVINLVPIENSTALINDMVVCLSGDTQKGESYWFDGIEWSLAQQKTGVNQAPLFDVFDSAGRSFGDLVTYPSSTFRGSQLFGYAVGGSTISDDVLGFALEYFNINNIGDILFNNYFYTDTFVFIRDNIGQEQQVSEGFARQYINRVSFGDLIGWVPAAMENRSRQQFRFVYDGSALILDVAIDQDSIYEPLQVFVNGSFVPPLSYSVTVTSNNTTIVMPGSTVQGANIEVQAISDQTSRVAFYQVPLNLENNALNKNSPRLTLGSIRNHYEGLAQNLRNLQGVVIGSNNTRDLGNILPWGDIVVQQSAPVSLAGVFLGRKEYNVFDAIAFNSQEYLKYKAKMTDLAGRGDFVNFTATEILDQVIDEMSLGKNERSPFYWSDMLPSNETYDENIYTVTPITTPVFDTLRVYDFESSNFQSILVYQNGEILTRGYDYEVGVDSATVTLNTVLTVGDQIVIREYNTTFGSYVPNTPTKLGLYPAYRPAIYTDETSIPATLVIRGHDGSITRAYGDARDEVLLEFEIRIFNNLKVSSAVPLTFDEVIPGQFRDTGYSLAEINNLLSTDFLNYVGWNNLDYVTQEYKRDNQFTYNYTRSANKLNNQPLLGAWRGIYQYFYDTTAPHTRPWEMLGFSQEPSWWESQYGPAPYTSGNLVLWEDLANGIVADPQNPKVLPRFRRPGLLDTIPVDSEGNLLPPFQTVMGNFDETSFRKSWTFGDGGPVESSWRASSAWPFTVMRLLALTRPAKFFSLFADRDRYQFNDALQQWLWDDRYRLDASAMAPLYGDDVSKASYIDWIIDYNRQRGVDSTVNLTADLANIDIRLCWRLAGFSDKNFLKIYTEKSTPGSANTNFLLPDESYQLLLYKNKPFESVSYSSVVVQRVEDGWSVQGYNLNDPYFEILVSRTRGRTETITVADTSVSVNIEYTNNVAKVPYGFVFTSEAAVSDFLLSYGELLIRQGFVFNTQENGYIVDWRQMVSEFLYWSQQGWDVGSLINLNPTATKVSITRLRAVANSLAPVTPRNMVLNQNRQPIDLNSLVINRFDNEFSINTTDSNTINFLTLDFVSYENIIVFDNASLFGDLIFEPTTGARQNRLLVSGILSADWNGTVNAPGFVINQDTVREWRPNQIYTKGEIVLFKDEYWSASTIIQPSETFDYTLWLKSDYQDIQKGLRPNAANDSTQLANAYSTYSANLEKEIDLFSYGLIGFRPRQYMQALNLDDVSQVNLYQQFLGSKGTLQSAEIFTLADLGKESAEYNVYEYWAILKGTYGATANRSYIELLMDQSRLNSDPSIMQVIEPGQTSQADQTVFVDGIWKESYKITDPEILPTLQAKNPDRSLPTAGYVNIDDVDFTVFNIDAVERSNLPVNDIGIGSTVWAAKVNAYDWSVYRSEVLPAQIIQVSDNLNGRSLVNFRGQPGLVLGAILIIKYFDDSIDGIYRVRSVVNPTSLIIDYEFTGDQTTITGIGIALTLQPARVRQPSDIVDLPYSKLLGTGARVWVDDNGHGQWTMLQKTAPFVNSENLDPQAPVADVGYGSVVVQGLQNLTALVAAPGYAGNKGGVYTFSRSPQGKYEPTGMIDLSANSVSGFGSSIDIGAQNWAIIGAPDSDSGRGYAAVIFNPTSSDIFEQRQILVAPDGDGSTQARFGSAVTTSLDEQWIYVSASGLDQVYAYGRVDVQQQRKTYATDGSTLTFNWSDYVRINAARPNQLQVLLNNGILYGSSPNPDYQIVGGSVQLLDENGDAYAPAADQELTLSRRSLVQLDRRLYYNVPQESVTPSGGSGARFTVDVTRGVRSATVVSGGTGYSVGDIITIDSARIGGGPDDLEILVTQVGLEYATLEDADAGESIITVTDTTGLVPGQDPPQELQQIGGTGSLAAGTEIVNVVPATRRVLLDVPVVSSGSLIFLATPGPITAISIFSGGTGIDDQTTFDVRDLLATANTIDSFTIRVGSTIYRPDIDYTFDVETGVLVFATNPAPGATIIAESITHFELSGILSVPSLTETDQFGSRITCTTDGRQIIAGAPGSTVNSLVGAGRSYVFDRSVQNITVTDADQTAYPTDEILVEPVSVKINGQKILDSATNIGGGYTITGPRSISITADLAVGDIITVDTNKFSLLQTLESHEAQSRANYGSVVDQCVNDCSLYVGSPNSDYTTRQGGLVEFLQNQSRVYGTIMSTVANPTLDPLIDSSLADIRINDVYVQLSTPALWTQTSSYDKDSFVAYLGALFSSTRAVPTDIDISDRSYWKPTSWCAVLAQDINDQTTNVTAATTPDLEFIGDGITREFPVGDIYSSAASYTAVVFVNNILQASGLEYVYNDQDKIVRFSQAPAAGSVITAVSGRLIVTVTDLQAAAPLNLLTVLPGSGTMFDVLGFDTYVWQQNIESPVAVQQARFGSSIFISDDFTSLVIGAPEGNTILATTFDSDRTLFDSRSTVFSEIQAISGAVYVYDFLPASNASVNNPGQFVFGQQINRVLQSFDRFGASVDLTTGVLLIGAPGADAGDSQINFGTVYQSRNLNNAPAWAVTRQQTPVVDVNLLNTVFIYDRVTGGAKQYLDFFDPLQGRLLGAVQQNLNYVSGVDPAAYNQGAVNNWGGNWGENHVGEIWLDTRDLRFVDPNQNDLVYASRRWGQLFPGSSVNVYQWIESSVPPGEYIGPGAPKDVRSYSIVSEIDNTGLFITKYYFWVSGINTVYRSAAKTLNINTIARYIENPRGSGIPYIAPLSSSAVAIYNSLPYISGLDSVIHIEFDQQFTDDAINVEYQLIAENREDGFLNDGLYNKFVDSLSGITASGAAVPDITLPPSELYGVQTRPRQSMFVDRLLALKNYLTRANTVLAQIPAAENRIFNLLNSREPEPTAVSGEWNMRVANSIELSYQDIDAVPLGYRYLVQNDSANEGLWAIYSVETGDLPGSRRLQLYRVQTYDTRQYWDFIDWYEPGYDPLSRIVRTVPNFAALSSISVPTGSSVKVQVNPQNKFEIYVRTANSWRRVALESGTIRFSEQLWNYNLGRYGFDSEVFDARYFDQEPVIETRNIVRAINQEIFIDELAIERNRLLILMFNFILSEQIAPTWLTKTSLIDVDHVIRELLPFQIYRQDNQDFVLDYIKEVKPYHTQIREFNLKYRGSDQYLGSVTDFDVPAFWDAAQNRFISPVLDNTGTLSVTSSTPSDSPIWQTFPYNQWFYNYRLEVESVDVIDGGSGYLVPPQVEVTGECLRPARMRATINAEGEVNAIIIEDRGEGYTTTAIITIDAGGGTGARAVARMGNDLVRHITTTIKYDRYQYRSDITDWVPNVIYHVNDQVRYEDRVWQAVSTSTGSVFDPDDWTVVPAADLSGVNRTRGYYIPSDLQPGIDLAQVIAGLDYPGVQVYGQDFLMLTELDAEYASDFVDPYLGVLPTSINVDGGAFIDTYSSHAPEELVPGSEFDTLDLRVISTPGFDASVGFGFGFPLAAISYVFDTLSPVYPYSQELEYAVEINVWNQTTGLQLVQGINYSVDWFAKTVTVNSGAAPGDSLQIFTYELGGGNQLYRNRYLGSEFDTTVLIPINRDLIFGVVAFVNGVQTNIRLISEITATVTGIEFFSSFAPEDVIVITVFGGNTDDVNYSWSVPLTQDFVSVGSYAFQLTNSLQGTNIPNIIVNVNGSRVTPAQSITYTTTGTGLLFALPVPSNYLNEDVVQADVSLYLDQTLLTPGTAWVLDPDDGSSDRTITLTATPPVGSELLISVATGCSYRVVGTALQFDPSRIAILSGDSISVTTFNDTSQQSIRTAVWQGPIEITGPTLVDRFDQGAPFGTVPFDEGDVSGEPGSYDFSAGSIVRVNRFDTGVDISDSQRLTVTLNGRYLFPEQEYTTDGSAVIVSGPTLNNNDIVAITSYTMFEVPGFVGFRIFQDMRGLQLSYRILDNTITVLTQELLKTDDVMHVLDAAKMPVPDLVAGKFGVVTVNGERITYRERNTSSNTLSGLRRGTAGTAAADHVLGSEVLDMSVGNLIPGQYQNTLDKQDFLADGIQTEFTAENISVSGLDSTELTEAVRVWVGGADVTADADVYTVQSAGPVSIVFSTPPIDGVEVTIGVVRGRSWYAPGPSTPSDGLPLQETDTVAARFIQGE